MIVVGVVKLCVVDVCCVVVWACVLLCFVWGWIGLVWVIVWCLMFVVCVVVGVCLR